MNTNSQTKLSKMRWDSRILNNLYQNQFWISMLKKTSTKTGNDRRWNENSTIRRVWKMITIKRDCVWSRSKDYWLPMSMVNIIPTHEDRFAVVPCAVYLPWRKVRNDDRQQQRQRRKEMERKWNKRERERKKKNHSELEAI